MTRYGRRPIATGPLHPRGCHCPHCDRTTRAEAEAARLTAAAAASDAAKLLARRELKREVKAAEGRAVISREIREADQLARSIAAARARADADPKAERLRALRAEGKTLAEAFEIIESEAGE